MGKCRVCQDKLTLPYIQCAECAPFFNLCLCCFSTGSKAGAHQPWHPYKLIHANLPVISTDWSAIEDIKMLNSIERYGLDWELISSMLPNKSEEQCQHHFYKYFVNEPIQKALIIPQNTKHNTKKVAETSGSKLTAVLEGLPSSAVDQKRGDWDCRYDNRAEEDFMAGEGGDETVRKLQMGIMEKYRQTLRKRKLLENLYYEYGTILLETPRPLNPHDTPPQVMELDPPGTFPLQPMLKMARYLTKPRFDDIRDKCKRVDELKRSIKELQTIRKNGITSKFGAEVYRKKRGERETKYGFKDNHTKCVRDVYFNNNLSINARKNNVKMWLRAATKTV
ncbi:transcriptional adapter 2-alpha-like [Bolinopsis microptera]|uniref:transcriptional adapter 2-alpha-like n=1 Tax=Bolinopsis microptera TaxID=2820187 RepID=UPI00307AF265